MTMEKATVREQAEEALKDGDVFSLRCALERTLIEGVGGSEVKVMEGYGPHGQIEVIANYIMAEIPGEPSRSEGAGDTAVRLLKEYRRILGLACEAV